MSLTLRVLAETEQTITLGWDPVPGCVGYRFSREGHEKFSHTWDPARSSVRFAKGSEWYRVEALGVGESGQYPPAAPSTEVLRDRPPGYPDYAGFERIALAGRNYLELPDDKDVLLDFGDFTYPHGPSLVGGHLVVGIGGCITISGSSRPDSLGLAIWPRTDASHYYLEGIRIQPTKLPDGRYSSTLHDGLVFRGPRGRVTTQNMRIGPISIKAGTSDSQGHADAVQFQAHFDGIWRADKMTSLIDYTGLMFANMLCRVADLRRWDIVPYDANPAYTDWTALYAGNPTTVAGLKLEEFYFDSSIAGRFAAAFYPQSLAAMATEGPRPEGNFVREEELALPYRSPGYA